MSWAAVDTGREQRHGVGNVIGLANGLAILVSGAVYLNRAGFNDRELKAGAAWLEFLLPNPGYCQ